MKRFFVIAAMLMSWFVYMNGSQTFAGPFATYSDCSNVAGFMNDNFRDYFTCR